MEVTQIKCQTGVRGVRGVKGEGVEGGLTYLSSRGAENDAESGSKTCDSTSQ